MSQSLTPPRSETAFDRSMASARGPAFVIATRAARLEMVNGAGRAWLGTPARRTPADPEAPTRDTAALDPAMPAVKRLRELADSLGPGTRCSVCLTFWTPHGERKTVCDVTFAGTAAGAGDGAGDGAGAGEVDDILAMVELDPDDPAVAAETIARPLATQPTPQRGPEPTPGDAAILREIARRIREAQTMHAEPPADLPDDRLDAAPEEPQAVRIAKLAHELKTPLSAIVAAAEIMRDERFGPMENARYRSYASDIFDSARHALMVIGNMLGDAAAGIEFDQGSSLPAMVFTEVDVNGVAESCVSSMQPLADAAGLALTAALDDGMPRVVADATAVRQIVLNLLNNAVKFSPRGGEIGLATHYHPGGRVEIVVRDTGRGMTADEIVKASAPQDRGPLLRREGGGLGIGLPLVAALARANGAGIAIASEPNRGTTVTISFAKDRVVPV